MLQCWASNLGKRPLFPEISARLQTMQGETGQAIERGKTVRQRGDTAVHVTQNPAFLDFVEDDSNVLSDSDT